MGNALTAKEFYDSRAAQGLGLHTEPVVPHSLFAKYLRNGSVDDRLGYGVLVFLAEQGDTRFATMYRHATALLHGLLGGERVGSSQEDTYESDRERWHFNAFEPTIPTVDQDLDEATVARLETLCDDVIGNTPAFAVEFRGVISTNNALLVCGYAEQPLVDMRARFVERLAQYPTEFGLPDGLVPNRYQAEKNSGTTAPITAVRLQGQLRDPGKYVDRVATLREVGLGTVGITRLSFVKHGWHNDPQQRRDIKTYNLP